MNHAGRIFCLLLALTLRVSAGPEEEFAAVVAAIQRGDTLIQEGRDRLAMEEYRQAQSALLKFKEVYPLWDAQVVSFRLRYLGERLGSGTEGGPTTSREAGAEAQALRNRIQHLERSNQQYQAQLNQLVAENHRLSTQLREALAIRPAAQDPVVIADNQSRLEEATREIASLRAKTKELERALADIPKADEARQNARDLAESRRNLNHALAEAEALRKQNESLRNQKSEPPPAARQSKSEPEALLQSARVTQRAMEIELERLKAENIRLAAELKQAEELARANLSAPRGTGPGHLRRIDRARLALAEENPVEALRLLDEELRASPNSAEAWYLTGRARLQAGRLEEVEPALKRALELSPNLGAAYAELAKWQFRRPGPDAALARWHYHKAIGLGYPRDPDFERAIGWEQPGTPR